MKPVYQTTFGTGEGNCCSACLASILEIPLEEVPFFFGKEVSALEGYENIRIYLNNLGYNFYLIKNFSPVFYDYISGETFDSISDYTSNSYWIAVGRPKGIPDSGHAVVYYGDKLVHDPNPNSLGLEGINAYLCIKKR